VGCTKQRTYNRREVLTQGELFLVLRHQACFRMLDANVSAQFKVSNNPNLTGWNATMSVLDILNQLQDTYGNPSMMTLFTNETL
jgi:hypothetical protein